LIIIIIVFLSPVQKLFVTFER